MFFSIFFGDKSSGSIFGASEDVVLILLLVVCMKIFKMEFGLNLGGIFL